VKIYFESTISSQIHVSGKSLRIEMGVSALLESALLEEALFATSTLPGPLGPPAPLGPPGPPEPPV
jgi:hypothetical protein